MAVKVNIVNIVIFILIHNSHEEREIWKGITFLLVIVLALD